MRAWFRENRGLVLLLALFGLFRTGVADWNPIPSGSMRPTLLEGDVVLVNRLAYDVKLPLTDLVLARLDDPQRGDVVTFARPGDGTRLIKRIAAVPGDLVEMRGKHLYVNGDPATYRVEAEIMEPLGDHRSGPALRLHEQVGGVGRDIQWLVGSATMPDFGLVQIPEGQYLMLGDNRDRSADSRFFGLVPREAIIGRAESILVSVAYQEDWLPRFGRFGQSLSAQR